MKKKTKKLNGFNTKTNLRAGGVCAMYDVDVDSVADFFANPEVPETVSNVQSVSCAEVVS